jgi:hypothetical protein
MCSFTTTRFVALLFVSIFLSCGVRTVAVAQTSSSAGKSDKPVSTQPQANPEMENVATKLLGSWSIVIQLEPNEQMPAGGKGSGEEVWQSGPGRLSLIENYHSTGDEGSIAGLGIFWWDADAKRFQVLWCENAGPTGCNLMSGGARWERNTLIIEHEWSERGKTSKVKEVFSDITDSSFTQTIYQGESNRELKKLLTVFATKKQLLSP